MMEWLLLNFLISAGFRVTSSLNSHQQEAFMSFWQILGKFAFSDKGETIQRISDTTSVSDEGTTYTKMGSTTVGSDGSVFTQMGSFSSDCSTRMGSTATGIGAVFNDRDDWFGSGMGSSHKPFGSDDNW
jgi:hypothetical protein